MAEFRARTLKARFTLGALLFTLLGKFISGEHQLPKFQQYGKSKRLGYSRIEEPIELPNLIEIQLSSYQWFLKTGLREALQEVFLFLILPEISNSTLLIIVWAIPNMMLTSVKRGMLVIKPHLNLRLD